MYQILIQNKKGWWIAMPFWHETLAAAWKCAREEYKDNVRIYQVVGEIERHHAKDGELDAAAELVPSNT